MKTPVIKTGTRYTKNGVSVDVHAVISEEVYLRQWPEGVTTQPLFSNCIRVPIAHFEEQIQGASITNLTWLKAEELP